MVVHSRITNSDSIWQSKQSPSCVDQWSWLAALYLNGVRSDTAELTVRSLVCIEGRATGKPNDNQAEYCFRDQSTHFDSSSKRTVTYLYLLDIRRLRQSEKKAA